MSCAEWFCLSPSRSGGAFEWAAWAVGTVATWEPPRAPASTLRSGRRAQQPKAGGVR